MLTHSHAHSLLHAAATTSSSFSFVISIFLVLHIAKLVCVSLRISSASVSPVLFFAVLDSSSSSASVYVVALCLSFRQDHAFSVTPLVYATLKTSDFMCNCYTPEQPKKNERKKTDYT